MCADDARFSRLSTYSATPSACGPFEQVFRGDERQRRNARAKGVERRREARFRDKPRFDC